MVKRKHTISKWLQQYAHYAALCVVSILYITTFLCIEKRGFWILDNENKFIQLQAINSSNFSDFSIPYTGISVDPDYEYNPMPPPFSIVKNNRLYSVYSPLFATISVVFYRLFSFAGLYILPLLFSILGLIGLIKIGKLLDLGIKTQSLTVIIAGVCTPLWFYSQVYWEHSIALCFCLWGILYFLRFAQNSSIKHLVFGSLTSSVSIYFREELVIFCIVLLASVLIIHRQERFKVACVSLTTMIIGIVPLLLFNWISIGHPLGFRISSNLAMGIGVLEHLSARPLVFYNLFLKSSQNMLLSLVFTVPLMFLFVFHHRVKKQLFTIGFTILSVFAFVLAIDYFYSLLSSNSPIKHIYYSNSLFIVSPILILAFLRNGDCKRENKVIHIENIIWLVIIGYSIIFALVSPIVTSFGIHWGNRILLLVYPLLAVLCVKNIKKWYSYSIKRINWQAIVCILTLLLGIAIQIYSVSVLHWKKTYSYHLNQEMQKYDGDVIVTNVEWVPQATFTVFYSKMIFWVPTLEKYNNLVNSLSSRGYKKILFVTHARNETRHLADDAFVDKRLNYFGLHLFVQHISSDTE